MSIDSDKRKIRVGLVGSGFIGQVAHLASYVDLPNVELVGLAELRPKLGKLVADRFNIPKLYDSHRNLLADQASQLDAVVAIVRREHTVSVAKDILQAGIPLFTEKPMAPTVAQGNSLVSISRELDCLYVTGFMRRHDEGVQLARTAFQDILSSGELGDPVLFRCYCFGGGDYCNISGQIRTEEPQPRHRELPIAPAWVPEALEKEYERFLNVFVQRSGSSRLTG